MIFDPNLPLKQRETLRQAEHGRLNIWEGSVRSGKTIVSLLAWVEYITQAPPGSLLMVGRTADTLRRNIIDPLIDLFGSENIRPVYGTGVCTIYGRQVHMLGADNQSAESRIRGMTLAGAYVDEISILGGPAGREYWNMLLTRLSIPGAKLFGTTNPGPPTHWLLTDFLEKAELVITQHGTIQRNTEAPKGLRCHRYRFTLEDNPTLSEEYKDSLKASLTGLWYSRFIDGNWVASEGAVYPMLDGTKHLVASDAWENVSYWIIAVDHGVTNPTHCLQIGIDEANRRIVVGKELRIKDTNLTVGQQAEQMMSWCKNTLNTHPADVSWIVDPAAKSLRNEIWNHSAAPQAFPADNTVLAGISDVGTLLGGTPPSLVITDAPILYTELSGYVWDTSASQRGEDRPVKKDDHSVDALRYGVRYLKGYWSTWRMTNTVLERKVDRMFTYRS